MRNRTYLVGTARSSEGPGYFSASSFLASPAASLFG